MMNNTYPTYLVHHGILGQKWGVRRYQNPDGSLTADGRKRYGLSDKRYNNSDRYRSDIRKRKEKYAADVSKGKTDKGVLKAKLKSDLKAMKNQRREDLKTSNQLISRQVTEFTQKQGLGKNFANFFFNGIYGGMAYNTLRANGDGHWTAEGKVVIASMLGGPIGQWALWGSEQYKMGQRY